MRYIKTFEAEQKDNFQKTVDAVNDYQTFVVGRWSEEENEEQSVMNNEVEIDNDVTKPKPDINVID